MAEVEGTTLKCAGCGVEWVAEMWRDYDDPCRDGEWYCVPCLLANKCGCPHRLRVKDAEAAIAAYCNDVLKTSPMRSRAVNEVLP